MIKAENNILYYLIILVVCFFAFFINNHIIPADLMESRNLATAQEMVRTGNYLLPTMNGELRLAKPPLPTWIAAGVEKVFPGNLEVQRCMTGLSGTLMVVFLFLLILRLTRNRDLGLIASLVLASCFNIIMMSRTATWDIYCHSFMLGAIYFLVVGFQQAGKQWKNFLIAGIFMGLSFLSKGPVSFYALLLPFLISYIIIYRPSAKDKVIPLISMVLVCLIISFWWPVYVMLFHPETGLAVADKESSSWLNHNVRPLYYYWQFSAEAGIWAVFWVTSLVWFYWKKKMNEITHKKAYLFSIIWTFTVFVLLSLIPEKKTRYLLPMLIPGAINVALYIYYCASHMMSKSEKLIFRINTSLIILILVALPVACYIIFFKEGLVSLPLYICISVVSILLAVFLIMSVFNKRSIHVTKVFAGIILTMIMVESLCLVPVGKIFINEDRHSIRMLRTNKDVYNLPFYYNENEQMRMELVYEANQLISPLDLTNDSLVYSKLPFVMVSKASIDSIFANKKVKVDFIDTFDNNWRQPDSRRYNKELVREVAIIKPK